MMHPTEILECISPALLAILAYTNAARLVKNTVVFYLFGALLGVVASLIGIALVWQRFIPRNLTPLPIYFGGWPLSIYLYYKAWLNFGWILQNYPMYLVAYIGAVGAVSAAICYRMGPPTDHRTLNLAKWLLQLCSLLVIYYSVPVQFKPAAVTVIFVLTTWKIWRKSYPIISTNLGKTCKQMRESVYGPAPRKLLTEDEYREQAENFTKVELEKLKQHISHSGNSWRTVSLLQDPKKIGSFIIGEADHVSSEEVSEHSAVWPEEDEEDESSEEEFISDDEDSPLATAVTTPPTRSKWN